MLKKILTFNIHYGKYLRSEMNKKTGELNSVNCMPVVIRIERPFIGKGYADTGGV